MQLSDDFEAWCGSEMSANETDIMYFLPSFNRIEKKNNKQQNNSCR